MKRIIIILAISLALTSCQRSCTQLSRSIQTGERDYDIVMFSGGDTIFVDHFRGILNNSEHSDGIYYYKDGILVEISGDYVTKSK